ncbi:MAG: 4-hydroxy-3-methylbut-2-enyl diphosphate reductase [Gammaproteobacteria bacterium]|nr:4-hydroxy-3-methylbut-2-enyl diphosphate reductase [Gammaproteobacteria bacterium]MCW8909750.1 4-hydroxy-3-methylbut-2-enyl diphosphate reductase [Gammaproteobacteria bacterium]MCW9006046.1 4-hydroxy-3-methylbut-2-enyl diphosphate reductase [Gammaproteobacteria bacterium]MCW9055417.1 4-hydroxy-3-methylbut-2-enyl diphosphate reductase [Gammaproteobacteria bacterium]
MEIQLANPRGFCAGVDRAIEIVERALDIFGAPIYVRHEVVHNRYVVDCLKNKGAIFVEELTEIPDDSTVIFSAHGVSQAVRKEAAKRKFQIFDATCPLVTKVHLEVARHAKNNDDVILIGHAGHPEVEGTLGQYNSTSNGNIYLVETVDDVKKLEVTNSSKLAFVTQTTLSVDDTISIINELKARFPDIQGPRKNDICYATQNRQDSVKELSENCDIILVVGSVNSSNSNRLKELASNKGVESYLIDNADELNKDWFINKNNIGITAGASAPEVLVKNVINKLNDWFAVSLSEDSKPKEQIVFQLPKELR